jgi:O-acetylserine/cysteine efflux transporter
MKNFHILLIVLVALIWGGNFTVIKIGLGEVSPPLLSSFRFLLAAFPLVFFIPKPRIDAKYVILFGLTSGVLQFTFLFFGLQHGMTAALSSIVLQTQVFFTIALGAILTLEKISRVSLGGILIAAFGLLIIGLELNNSDFFISFALVVLAAMFWAVSNLITRKAGNINMLSFVVWSSLVPIIPLFLINVYLYGSDQTLREIQQIGVNGSLSILYLAYPTTIVGYGIWAWLISLYGLNKVVPFTLLVPIFGIASGALFLGESLSSYQVVATIMIFIGLIVHVLSFSSTRLVKV